MLRACRKLLRPGGRLAFYAFHSAPGLTDADYRKALRAGPRAVGTRRRDYPEMLTAAGFASVETVDLTMEYRETACQLLELRDRQSEELKIACVGESFEQRQKELRESLTAIDEGNLMRSLFLARRPV